MGHKTCLDSYAAMKNGRSNMAHYPCRLRKLMSNLRKIVNHHVPHFFNLPDFLRKWLLILLYFLLINDMIVT